MIETPDWTSFWENSLAVNPECRWFQFAATDAAALHAQLALVAQNRSTAKRQPYDASYYYQRGEALRLVGACVGDPSARISDGIIGAVALLITTDVRRVSYMTVEDHELTSN